MDDHEYQPIEYSDLTPAQQAQADKIFTLKLRPMTAYTYALRADGSLSSARYFKSEILKDPAVLRALFG